MNFLLSDSLVKWEILFLLANLGYIVFFIVYELGNIFIKIKKIVKPNRIILEDHEIKAQIEEKINATVTESPTLEISEEKKEDENIGEKLLVKEEEKKEEKDKKSELSKEEKDEVNEILKLAQTKVARGEYSDAKAKIIEGLSIDKFHKGLNLLLASLYEKDKDYKKAEFIYKDLIILNDHDTEVYLKLGFILSLQGKYEVAYEIYKKLHSLDKSNMESIEMLSNLAHHLGNFEDSRLYAKAFLKKNPRNIDILYLQALNHINLEDRKEALEILKKVKIQEPYNVKVNELIEKIILELELENNFSTQEK